jgi:hypothetical protein
MSSALRKLFESQGAPGGNTLLPGNYDPSKKRNDQGRKIKPNFRASGLVAGVKPDPNGITILSGNDKPPGYEGSSAIAKLRNKNKSRKNKNHNKNKSRKNKNRNKNKSRKNRNKNKSRKNRNRK